MNLKSGEGVTPCAFPDQEKETLGGAVSGVWQQPISLSE